MARVKKGASSLTTETVGSAHQQRLQRRRGRLIDGAVVFEDGLDARDFVGKLVLPPGGMDELREMFMTAAGRGWQVQVHVVGDARTPRSYGNAIHEAAYLARRV